MTMRHWTTVRHRACQALCQSGLRHGQDACTQWRTLFNMANTLQNWCRIGLVSTGRSGSCWRAILPIALELRHGAVVVPVSTTASGQARAHSDSSAPIEMFLLGRMLMPLEMRRVCERCGAVLAPADEAYICTYECTFCPTCTHAMAAICPIVVASSYAAPDVLRHGARSEGDWVAWVMVTPTRVLCSPVVELRQYTLHPGQRDTLRSTSSIANSSKAKKRSARGSSANFAILIIRIVLCGFAAFRTWPHAEKRCRPSIVDRCGKRTAQRPTLR